MSLWRIACLLTTGLMAPASLKAAEISGYQANRHDRFADSAAFLARDFDLSGLALARNGAWLTLIRPNVFLSSAHFFPEPGTTITFYLTNNPAGPRTTVAVGQETLQLGDSDIHIGTLDKPLLCGYRFYPFTTQAVRNNYTNRRGPFRANAESFINSPWFEAHAWLLARSPGGNRQEIDIAVGRNRLDAFQAGVQTEETSGDAFLSVVQSPGQSGFLNDELQVGLGDSGAPVFVEQNGAWVLVGLTWFLSTEGSLGIVNGHSVVGNQAGAIQAFLNSHARPCQSTWGGFPLYPDGRSVDAAGFLGWLDIGLTPWNWSHRLGGWVYLPEEAVQPSGAWIYRPAIR